jgi:hypothetical protein
MRPPRPDGDTIVRMPVDVGRRGRVGSVPVSGRFEIRVSGRLSDRVRAAFPDMDVVEVPAETVLSGRSWDEDEVHGVLGRIQALGLEVVSLRQLPGEPDDGPGHAEGA